MPIRGVRSTSGRRGRNERERRLRQIGAVVLARQAERLREPAGAGAQEPQVREPAPRAHRVEAVRRLERPSSTAAPRPRSSQTMFAHQWRPYER